MAFKKQMNYETTINAGVRGGGKASASQNTTQVKKEKKRLQRKSNFRRLFGVV